MARNISSDAVEDNISSDAAEGNGTSSSDAVEGSNLSEDAVEDNISSPDAVEDNISSSDAVEDGNTSLDTVEDGECNHNLTVATEENDIRINEEVALPFHLAADHYDVMIWYDDKSDPELVRARNLKKFLIANCKKNCKKDCGFDIKVLILQDDPYFAQVTGKVSVMEKAHDMCTLYFLLLSPEFGNNEFQPYAKDMYIWESVNDPEKKWSVIPLHSKKLTYKTPKTINCLTGINIERDMIGDLADINDENLNVDEIEPRPPFENKVRMLIKEKVLMRKKRQEELEKKRNEYIETELHKRRLQAVDEKVKEERRQKLREQEIRKAEAVARKNLMERQALELSDEDERPIIKIEVTKVDTSSPLFLERLRDPDVYPVKHTSRGRAVIISNEKFRKREKNRAGAQYDRQNLEALLCHLGFKTVVHRDKTAEEMEKIIDTESKCEDHAESDSFIMAVLSHGSEEGVSGTDSVTVKIQEKITKAFDGRECHRLAGKPKLFIIQACQGKDTTKGVWQADASEEGEEEDGEEEEEEEEEEALSQLFALEQIRIQDEYQQDAVPDPGCRGGVAHEKGDMCFFNSTVSGYVSWRNTQKGTWFIRMIVKVFMRDAHIAHVEDLLRRVRREVFKVSGKAQADNRSNKEWLQVPVITFNSILKNWYLFPGYTPPPPQK